jgi:cyclophilin family peptidyl-prolyl cis-trans isomerase
VGTAKRERQKTNRQQRLEELQRQQRRDRTKRRVITWAVIIVVAGAALYGVSLLISSGDDNDTATSETSVATTATTTPVSTPATTVFQPTTVPGAAITGTTPCPNADGTSPRTITFAEPPPMCIDAAKTYTATVVTNKGEFTVDLDAAKAPQTVNNFVVLSRYHYYDGVLCHRVITSFVVQCGDPTGTGSGPNPGYTIPDELPATGAYTDGSLAMANTGAPNSGGGQFFIITGEQGRSLPASYSLFGQVSQGFDTTVKALEATADPAASNGTPTLEPIYIESVTITEA